MRDVKPLEGASTPRSRKRSKLVSDNPAPSLELIKKGARPPLRYESHRWRHLAAVGQSVDRGFEEVPSSIYPTADIKRPKPDLMAPAQARLIWRCTVWEPVKSYDVGMIGRLPFSLPRT